MATTKVCAICGIDVAKKPRVKDAHGRYFCEPCATKAEAASKRPVISQTQRAVDDVIPLEGAMDQFVSEAISASPPLAEAAPIGPASSCPGCSSTMPAGAQICMVCGYNLQTGKAIRTKVVSAPKEKRAGLKLSLGTNTDWNEVARVAGGFLLYFMLMSVLSLISPIARFALVLSVGGYGLYYVLGMVIQPFLEGRLLWGLYHLGALGGGFAAGYYAVADQSPLLLLIPVGSQIPSVYYVFWRCENNWLKAMWLLSLLSAFAIFVIVIVAGFTAISSGEFR